VGVWESLRILKALVGTVLLSRVRGMVTEQFSSTAPIKFGPYAVKFTVRPAAGNAPTASRPLTDNFLREELADRLRQGDVLLDFLVQFYVDDKRTPIEDTSIPWRPDDAPLVTVAQLRIPSCDLDDSRTRALSEALDQLSFSPWHATEDHRPPSLARLRTFSTRSIPQVGGIRTQAGAAYDADLVFRREVSPRRAPDILYDLCRRFLRRHGFLSHLRSLRGLR
jgi:hypothetical protein